MKTRSAPRTIDEYIAGFPPEIRTRLEEIRRTIRKAAPGAQEAIRYQLPTFIQEGNLVHFGAFRQHIGFYATPSGHAEFERALAAYKRAKGSVQFPLDKPAPLGLISRMVKFRVKENMENAAKRGKG
jgi:uncharacterized protein YdhG (YjbR/CyaY superfamily)